MNLTAPPPTLQCFLFFFFTVLGILPTSISIKELIYLFYFIFGWGRGGSSLRSPAASPPSPRSPSPGARHLGAESERTRSRSDGSWNHFIIRYYGGSVPPRSGGGGNKYCQTRAKCAKYAEPARVIFRRGWGGGRVTEDFFFSAALFKMFSVELRAIPPRPPSGFDRSSALEFAGVI